LKSQGKRVLAYLETMRNELGNDEHIQQLILATQNGFFVRGMEV